MLLPAALALPACGGEGKRDVASNAVAAVGDETIERAEFDALMNQARCRYKSRGTPFPKVGTPEYQSLKNQLMQFLVQRAQFAQEAEELDVAVTDKQVEDRLGQIKQQFFAGNEKRYRAGLKAQCLNQAQAEQTIRDQLTSEAL